MAQGSAFTLVPQEVIVLEPIYHNVITPTESMKKEYLNISSTPIERFILRFKGISNAVREDTLLAHFKDQTGGYYPFSWQSVPNYINSGANITGRWVKGSLSMVPVGYDAYNCEVIFEKDN